MATNSGMSYSGMQSLISLLEHRKAAIDTILTDTLPGISSSVASVYSGEAADTYKSTLKSTADNMEQTLSELISKLKTTAEETEAKYKQQDAKMQSSVSGGGN